MLYSLAMVLMKWAFHMASLWHEKASLRIKGLRMQTTPAKGGKKRIWIHCASAGEYEQAIPLMDNIRAKADVEMVISFFSPSGMQYHDLQPKADFACYLPFDLKTDINAFIDLLQPDAAIWMKYEFWLNTLTILHERRIPLYLANADLGGLEKRKGWYASVVRKSLPLFDKVYAVSEGSALAVICRHVEICFDSKWLKADLNSQAPFSDPVIEQWLNEKPCLVMGSTHPEDIHFVMEGIRGYLEDFKWMLVPHDADRVNIHHIIETLPEGKVSVYSEGISKESPVLVVDKVGVLKYLYRYGVAAYIGGGFGKAVHNTLEAAAYRIPLACGPAVEGMPEVSQLRSAGAIAILERKEDWLMFMDQLASGKWTYPKERVDDLFSRAREWNVANLLSEELAEMWDY